MPDVPSFDLPHEVSALRDLALDLRWTWSHEADALWRSLDAEAWEQTRNPWAMLQGVSADRLRALAADGLFSAELQRLAAAREAYLSTPGWFATNYGAAALRGVAYFSLEFGIGEALPLYAGGLGVLAGDYLKTASDMGVPIIGIGLLYREGYFRQVIDAGGWQRESFPANDPASMPIQPVRTADASWLHIPLDLPGRRLLLRVWRAQVGRTALYLLDADHPLNSPADRGITARLYEVAVEIRLLQALVLGVAGWGVVEAVAPDTEICHLNEGDAAFAAVGRAYSISRKSGLRFADAVCVARAGNVFTTHTAVDSGAHQLSPVLLTNYARCVVGDDKDAQSFLLALGRANADDDCEPFNAAYLAMRSCAHAIGVSRQHEHVSHRIFQPLFPRWPECEVPIGHVTNGVHVPTWDSVEADRLWTASCGKERWRSATGALAEQVASLTDQELWEMRGAGRHALVHNARRRLGRQLAARGEPHDVIALSAKVLDPDILTLGFARRFTEYKRPDLLLRDPGRLRRLLTNEERPAQLIVAGKAHPADAEGKRMIREWIELARELRRHLVFLEDYDISLAQELVQGVDVWVNTPRRPWEACGTSGMKVLVNGGLNLSVLDGWWEEAYDGEVGWAVRDRTELTAAEQDRSAATTLHDLLENEIAPEFYARDANGVPGRWIERIRRSLSGLTPAYSSNRMLEEHVERMYLPAAGEWRRRSAENGATAVAIGRWIHRLRESWSQLRVGVPMATLGEATLHVSAPIFLGTISAADVVVQLYADPAAEGQLPIVITMERQAAVSGGGDGCIIYSAAVPETRPANDYTIRVIPAHPGVRIPAELALITWQK